MDASKDGLPNVRELSSGAISLLALAAGAFDDKTGQRRHDLLNSAALRLSWDVCGELPAECQALLSQRPNKLLTWMDATVPPRSLFQFCGWLADGLHQRICGRHSSLSTLPGSFPTGFDHSIYLAIGQSMAHFLGMAGGEGPDFETVVVKVARLNPSEVQREFLRNYFGNVMQDYFDAAQIRKRNPRLPQTTEPDLRRVDARIAADLVFQSLEAGEDPIEWSSFQKAVRPFFGAIFLAEREQFDQSR